VPTFTNAHIASDPMALRVGFGLDQQLPGMGRSLNRALEGRVAALIWA
jgi:hypothetical protein